MSTATTDPRTAPDRSPSRGAALEGFGSALRSEATKLRTVRGWLVGLGVAAVLLVAIAAIDAAGRHVVCSPGTPAEGTGSSGTGGTGSGGGGSGGAGDGNSCGPPKQLLGPGGEAVVDRFFVVRQTLTGNGSVTARVTSLEGLQPGNGDGPEPWAKAGLIVKAGTTPGSPYAAVMVTGEHGVRMQDDYTHDVAGSAGAVTASSPRWLRLTRSGDRVTGYESTDGTRWTELGHADLSGLGTSATVGLFVASPPHEETTLQFGGVGSNGGPSLARAVFDEVGLTGGWSGGAWQGQPVGDSGGGPGNAPEPPQGDFRESGGQFTVAGNGDIAPAVGGPGGGPERYLGGTFAALLAAIVVGTMFGTSEYRRRLVRTTFAATPRRGQVLAAKAVVLAGATFLIGLVGTLVALWVGDVLGGDGGVPVLPASTWVEIRMVAGTAAMLALAAVLALAVGTMLRRSAAAVAGAISLVVLPFVLAVAVILPVVAGEWLLRLTPAAGFAVQQTQPEYDQVLAAYVPSLGYFPLPWWAGFAVMFAWTAAALALATVVVRRRDA